MAEPNTIYKLTILYLLKAQKTPLSNAQITDFFLEKDYTDYFTVQLALGDLQDSGLINTENTFRSTRYSITDAGRETLRYFEDKLTPEIMEDAEGYLREKGLELQEENSLLADYFRTTDQEYAVRLQYRERGRQRIDLTLTVPGKEAAEAACLNWREASGDVYAYLLELLIR